MRLGELGKLAIQAGSMEALAGDEAPTGDTTAQAKVPLFSPTVCMGGAKCLQNVFYCFLPP